jgi:hypothetical protein
VLGLAACDAGDDRDVLALEEPIAPGVECAYGGVRVSTGIDDDGSGTLDSMEIDDVAVVCRDGRTIDGDFTVRNNDDAQRLRGVNVITGTLTIDAPNLGELDLGSLVRVDGGLDCAAFAAPLAAPALQSVGGAMRLSIAQCQPPDMRALQSVGGDLVIQCVAFASAGVVYDLPALATVGGGLDFYGAVSVSIPAVARVDFLRALPRPPIIENGLNRVRTIALPALATIEGPLDLEYTELQSLQLPALANVSSITIQNNSMLCDSVATELATRTGAPSTISNNASCFR